MGKYDHIISQMALFDPRQQFIDALPADHIEPARRLILGLEYLSQNATGMLFPTRVPVPNWYRSVSNRIVLSWTPYAGGGPVLKVMFWGSPIDHVGWDIRNRPQDPSYARGDIHLMADTLKFPPEFLEAWSRLAPYPEYHHPHTSPWASPWASLDWRRSETAAWHAKQQKHDGRKIDDWLEFGDMLCHPPVKFADASAWEYDDSRSSSVPSSISIEKPKGASPGPKGRYIGRRIP